MIISNTIPQHIAFQLNQQRPKVNKTANTSNDETCSENFLQQCFEHQEGVLKNEEIEKQTGFEDILVALLQNNNINPYNVEQNILLAKEYMSRI